MDNKSNLTTLFTVGEKVILDVEFNNTSIVEVVHQTPKRLYTRVKSKDGDEWDVMTYRLKSYKFTNLKEII